jgi:hypothetical protein
MWKSSLEPRGPMGGAALMGAGTTWRFGPRDNDAPAGALLEVERAPPDLASLSKRRLRSMLAAGVEILECRRVLAKGGLNLVGEVLRGQEAFVEYDHYPGNDVYDADTRSQYYYHSHRGMVGEHGHFHTFVRSAEADPEKPTEPAEQGVPVPLIAISMDPYGWPSGLFATNRWVTGGLWQPAKATLSMLSGFRIDHAYPSWPLNRWISAMFILFRPHVELLLAHRDAVIAHWSRARPGTEVLEDRKLEITGSLAVSVEQTVRDLKALLNGKEPA